MEFGGLNAAAQLLVSSLQSSPSPNTPRDFPSLVLKLGSTVTDVLGEIGPAVASLRGLRSLTLDLNRTWLEDGILAASLLQHLVLRATALTELDLRVRCCQLREESERWLFCLAPYRIVRFFFLE